MPEKKELKVTRIYNAPVELVWQTWTDPILVRRWWGPDKFTCPRAEIDFREGGRSIVSMKSPKEFGGNEWYSVWNYKKIVPLVSIDFIQNLSDKNGKKMHPTEVGMPPDFPEDIRTVVTFKKLSPNKTEMTVTEYADMGQTSEFARIGLEQSLDKIGLIFDVQT